VELGDGAWDCSHNSIPYGQHDLALITQVEPKGSLSDGGSWRIFHDLMESTLHPEYVPCLAHSFTGAGLFLRVGGRSEGVQTNA
jgi:hypothetical protein